MMQSTSSFINVESNNVSVEVMPLARTHNQKLISDACSKNIRITCFIGLHKGLLGKLKQPHTERKTN